MRDKNEVCIRGRLAFDAEFHDSPKRTTFAVITNIPFVNKNGDAGRETTMHRVVVWNRRLSALKRGDEVSVTGMVSILETDDKSRYRIIADEVHKIGML
jgi:single-stranded DNA-binding protein